MTINRYGTVSFILFSLAASIAAAGNAKGNDCEASSTAILALGIGSRGLLLKHKRYSAMKKSSLKAQAVKRTHWMYVSLRLRIISSKTYLLVVKFHDTTPARRDILMALTLPAHCQSCIHMHVMACKIECDQSLEDHCVPRHSERKEDEQARCRTAVGYHVQHCTEASRLFECPCCEAVQRIEETAD